MCQVILTRSQNEFGPKHLADENCLYDSIQEELILLSERQDSYPSESIGNGLSRFSLYDLLSCPDDNKVKLLVRLMVVTMKEYHGTMEGLEKKLRCLEETIGLEAGRWLLNYRASGYPAVSHSDIYRKVYDPHYRVIKWEFANFFPVLSAVQHLLFSRREPIVVSIDGRCGSGKSSLAKLIQKVFSCNVFHMDDFYLPSQQRAATWESIPAGNMDLKRFREEVLLPAKAGRGVIYRPYDCQNCRLSEPIYFSPARLNVIEGSYSQHPLLADQYDLKLFLTCDPEVQKKRLEAREGDKVSIFFFHWIPMEERYFNVFAIENNSDLVLDTGRLLE